jgi:hypothetical protein
MSDEIDVCDWEPDESYTEYWETPDTFNGMCGICWSITDYEGQPFNTIDMNYCPKCGRPINVLPREQTGDDEDD